MLQENETAKLPSNRPSFISQLEVRVDPACSTHLEMHVTVHTRATLRPCYLWSYDKSRLLIIPASSTAWVPLTLPPLSGTKNRNPGTNMASSQRAVFISRSNRKVRITTPIPIFQNLVNCLAAPFEWQRDSDTFVYQSFPTFQLQILKCTWAYIVPNYPSICSKRGRRKWRVLFKRFWLNSVSFV